MIQSANSKRANRGALFLRGLLGASAFLICWEVLGRSNLYPQYLLPPASSVFSHFGNGQFLSELSKNLVLTIGRAMLGYIIATAIGTILGILLGRSKVLLEFLEPVIEFLRPLPSSAIVPVALLFLGLGGKMVVFTVAFGATWPILVASVQGARSIDPVMIETARMLKLPRPVTAMYVIIPAALPFIVAGLRTSLAVSLILAVTAEMIAGSNGMGFLILDLERAFRTSEMYSAIVAIGIVGYVLNAAFNRIERKVIFWQDS